MMEREERLRLPAKWFPELWTQRVRLRWRPKWDFHSKKASILDGIDAVAQIHAWRISGDEVGALVGDHSCELVARQNGLSLNAMRRGVELEPLVKAFRAAWDVLEPKPLTFMSLGFQALVPVLGDYSTIRGVAARGLFGQLGDQLAPTDFAMLTDFEVEGFEVKAEFGIVSRDEVGPRLAGLHGRMGHDPGDASSLLGDDDQKYPEVALFIDSSWKPRSLPSGPDEAIDVWAGTVEEAATLADTLAKAAQVNREVNSSDDGSTGGRDS